MALNDWGLYGIYAGSPYGPKGTDSIGNVPSVGSLYKDVTKKLSSWGNQAQADLRQNYMNAMGMAQQSLASSGLSGTTIAPSMRMGYMRQYQQAMNRLNDQLQQTKLGYQTQIGMQGAQMKQQQQQFQQQLAYQYSALAQRGMGGGGGGGGSSGGGDGLALKPFGNRLGGGGGRSSGGGGGLGGWTGWSSPGGSITYFGGEDFGDYYGDYYGDDSGFDSGGYDSGGYYPEYTGYGGDDFGAYGGDWGGGYEDSGTAETDSWDDSGW